MQASIPDHVLVFRAHGTVRKEDIDEFDRRIQEKLAEHERIGVVADIEEMEGMTVGAVMKDILAELKYLGDWHRFPRVAVVASGGFLKSTAEAVGKLLPQVEVQTFEPEEFERAVDFAGSFRTGQSS
jgi:hypothetical protein